jgi:hypothetical protein
MHPVFLRRSRAAFADAAPSSEGDLAGMSTTTSLALMIVPLLMLLSGMSKRRLEWKPRNRFRRRSRK